MSLVDGIKSALAAIAADIRSITEAGYLTEGTIVEINDVSEIPETPVPGVILYVIPED